MEMHIEDLDKNIPILDWSHQNERRNQLQSP